MTTITHPHPGITQVSIPCSFRLRRGKGELVHGHVVAFVGIPSGDINLSCVRAVVLTEDGLLVEKDLDALFVESAG